MAYLDRIYHLTRCDKCQGITSISKRPPMDRMTTTIRNYYPAIISVGISAIIILVLGLVKLA